jgi:SagB-type dehydrogenase family enzyme
MKKQKKTMTPEEFAQEEKGIVWMMVDTAANMPVTIYAESLGVKAPEACYRSAVFAENSTRLLGEEYLLNAKRSSLEIGMPMGVFHYSSSIGVKGALSHRELKEENIIDNSRTIALPRYLPLKASLGSVLRARRSIREMGSTPLSMEQLSSLLYYGDGPSGKFDFNTFHNMPATASLGDDYTGVVRTAPSGGGLYPITLYFIAFHVKGLEPGIYSYLPLTHTIRLIRSLDEQAMEEFNRISSFGININNDTLGLAIYYVYSLYDNSRKYGDMAMQFAYIEAGEIAENIQLTANALDLAATDIGGYEKGLTEEFLGLDGLSKHVIHLTLVGSLK